MFKIKYCGSWNYKPQAESLSVDMNNEGYHTVYEEGETGQFELFLKDESLVKAGHGVFFDIEDVKIEIMKKTKQELFSN